MPVEMKKGIRKRIACMMGTTQKAIREAEAHKAGRVTDQEFADGITVGIWIGACLAHVRIEWQDIEEIKEQE